MGAVLLSINYRTGRRWAYLLEWGVETDGEVIDQKATGVTVNSESQFEMTLSYNDDTGAHHRASMRTFIPEDLLDEARETILYDRRAPHRAIAVDGLPDICA